MQLQFKNSFIGYLTFYKHIVGNHVFCYLALTALVGVLDGFGLAMFIPLLSATSGDTAPAGGDQSMGNLKFLVDFLGSFGLSLTLNHILVFLVLLFSLKGLIYFLQVKYYAFIRYLFLSKVRFALVDDLQNLTYEGYTKIDSGRIQNNLVGEVGKLFSTMNSYFQSAQMAILLITYIGLAFVANWQFAILIGIGGALSNIFFRRIYKFTKAASIAISKKGNNFNAYLIQAVIYFKYLKATNYFRSYAEKLRKVIRETEMLNLKMGHYQAIVSGVREPVIILVITLVISAQINYLGGSLSSILVSLLFFYRALSSLTTLQTNWHAFIQNVGSMDSVSSISAEMQVYAEKKHSTPYEKPFEKLVAKNLGLSYGEKVILGDINIEIFRNQTVAFVGESGSGKTSLANMLAGLIIPSHGKVLLDGTTDLKNIALDDFRSKIGYITQDPVIFSDTIFNNITFWDESNEANMVRFNKAVALASLSEFIDNQEEKEHSLLGDHGMLISGGQKQRVSIARELYKEVDLLILDEATSALDSETEMIIKENIERLKGKYTMIVIAHRLSTIKNADRIYLLGGGKVKDTGSFDELYAHSTQFKKMVELQNLAL
jgi:ABC-type multidrug transport system fused ATPase/permease subunit